MIKKENKSDSLIETLFGMTLTQFKTQILNLNSPRQKTRQIQTINKTEMTLITFAQDLMIGMDKSWSWAIITLKRMDQ